jgi:hypothetical protein
MWYEQLFSDIFTNIFNLNTIRISSRKKFNKQELEEISPSSTDVRRHDL